MKLPKCSVLVLIFTFGTTPMTFAGGDGGPGPEGSSKGNSIKGLRGGDSGGPCSLDVLDATFESSEDLKLISLGQGGNG